MPTQRPSFFANFFSAFRARSTPGPFQAKSSTTTGAISPAAITASAQFSTTSATAPSSAVPRNISPKPNTNGPSGSSQTTQAQPMKPTSTSPFATTAISSSPGTTFYRRPPSPSPSHNLAKSPGHTTPTQMSRGRQRRDSGSSNSSGGFIEAMGSEKWYVGGRNAAGEERFYQLGLVTANSGKRVRSLDRLSL